MPTQRPTRPPAVLDSLWPTFVTPWLYIGSAQQAACAPRLRQLRITHIINAAREVTPSHPGQFHYLHIAARDSTQERLRPRFFDVASYVHRARESGGKTLIHCLEGISRSATLALATRIINEHVSLLEAFDELNACRPIEPNHQFLFELRKLELEWLGSCTTKQLTLLDDIKLPNRKQLVREQVVELLAKAAQLPRAHAQQWPEFTRALESLRSIYVESDVFEKTIMDALEMYASNTCHDAAARHALALLLRDLSTRLVEVEVPPATRLGALIQSAGWHELCIDAPRLPGYIAELQKQLALPSL